MHAAIAKVCELYDERDPETGRLRDLKPHEQALLIAVNQIRNQTSRTRDIAAELFGRESKTYLASSHLSDRQEADHLTKALAKYEQALQEA
jgi:hypothetical protein